MDMMKKLEQAVSSKTKLPSTRANLRVPKILKAELSKIAMRRKVSLNHLAVRALYTYVKRAA